MLRKIKACNSIEIKHIENKNVKYLMNAFKNYLWIYKYSRSIQTQKKKNWDSFMTCNLKLFIYLINLNFKLLF